MVSSLLFTSKAAYNRHMEISLGPELEAKLKRIASQAGKAPDEVVRELVASYLDHDEWSSALASAAVEEKEVTAETAAAIDRSRASLARGEAIPYEDIRREFGLSK
jgi:predicted transcriptional regulator